MARVGQAVNNPVGFLKQYADRSKKLYEGDMIKGEVRWLVNYLESLPFFVVKLWQFKIAALSEYLLIIHHSSPWFSRYWWFPQKQKWSWDNSGTTPIGRRDVEVVINGNTLSEVPRDQAIPDIRLNIGRMKRSDHNFRPRKALNPRWRKEMFWKLKLTFPKGGEQQLTSSWDDKNGNSDETFEFSKQIHWHQFWFHKCCFKWEVDLI